MRGLVLLSVVSVILVSGCTGNGDSGSGGQAGSRDFLMGVTPTPKSVPETVFEDIQEAYQEAGEIGEVSMVWIEPSGIGQFERLKQNQVVTALRVYGLKPVLTLTFATLREVEGGLEYQVTAPEGVNADLSDPEFRELWVKEARDIAGEFRPEYFSLGNEVNDYFYFHPGELDSYISLFKEAKEAIKEVSPGTGVFVVFSYNHIIDSGQWDMIEAFSERADLTGLTTYPWQHYGNPDEIPGDYYTRVGEHSTKPVAFTEIGWVSDEGAGGSEAEQAEFLKRFPELISGMDVEMVNWLFLHEMDITGSLASASRPETGTIGLKRKDGTEKEVYRAWLELKDLPVSF